MPLRSLGSQLVPLIPTLTGLQPLWSSLPFLNTPRSCLPQILHFVPSTLVLFLYNLHICIILEFSLNTRGLPWWFSGKDSACPCRRRGFDPWVGKILWRRKWQPTPVFLPGKYHGQRNLAGCSPWDCKESSMTK